MTSEKSESAYEVSHLTGVYETLISTLDEKFEMYLGIVLLLGYTAIILVDIFRRTFLGTQSVWGLAIVQGMFVWVAWLSAAYAVRHNAHIRFTLLLQLASNRVTYAVYFIEWTLWLIVGGVIFRYSLNVLNDYQVSGAEVVGTPVPRYLLYLAVPVGFGLILIRVAQQMYLVTRQYRDNQDINIEPGFGGE